MTKSELIKKFFSERNVDTQYDKIMNSIHRHQQNKIFVYEIILIVIFGGILVNIISSSMYDLYVNASGQRAIDMLILSAIMLLLFSLLYSYLSKKYFSTYPVEFQIYVSMFDLYNSLGYEKNEVIEFIETEGFSEETFLVLFNEIKKEILSTNFIYNAYNFKYDSEEDFSNGKIIFYKGNSGDISIQLKIMISPIYNVVEKDKYNSLIFLLSYIIKNPNSPLVDEFLFDLKEYVLDLSFEEFCDLAYNELQHLSI